MKKALAIALGLISSVAIATEAPKTKAADQTKPVEFVAQPSLVLEVYDTNNKVRKRIQGRKYSVSQKGLSLCWTAFRMPFKATNTVREVFISPAKAKFADPKSTIVGSEDGKTHSITSQLASVNNELIDRCWKFSNQDPLGTYQVKVFVNDIEFPPQSFEVVK